MSDNKLNEIMEQGGAGMDRMLEQADRQGHGNETRGAGTGAALGAVAGSLVQGVLGAAVGGGLGALIGSVVGRGLDSNDS